MIEALQHLFHNDHGERQALISFLAVQWPLLRLWLAGVWLRWRARG